MGFWPLWVVGHFGVVAVIGRWPFWFVAIFVCGHCGVLAVLTILPFNSHNTEVLLYYTFFKYMITSFYIHLHSFQSLSDNMFLLVSVDITIEVSEVIWYWIVFQKIQIHSIPPAGPLVLRNIGQTSASSTSCMCCEGYQGSVSQ